MSFIYLIFKDSKLLAHTNDERLLKYYKKDRDYNDYEIVKIQEKDINYHLRNDDSFVLKELQYYEVYKTVLTEQELIDGFNIMRDKLIEIVEMKELLLGYLDFLKVDDYEKKTIKAFIQFIEYMEGDLLTEESSVFLSDYFDLTTFLQLLKRYG